MALPFKRALVTGGAGFIGSTIVDELIRHSVNVTILDDFSNGKRSNVTKSGYITLFDGNILDGFILERAMHGQEVVFHEAGVVDVARSVKEPDIFYKVNYEGTLAVLKAATKARVSKVVMASTAAVYGTSKDFPRKETGETLPVSPYAISKLSAEKWAANAILGDLEVVALRYFNVYGPRSSVKAYSGALGTFAKQILKGEDLTVYGTGEQTRDFIHVADIVRANILAASAYPTLKRFNVYNVGTGKETTITELISHLSQILMRYPKVNYAEKRPGDTFRSVADITKIASDPDMRFLPQYDIQEGLRQYLQAETPLLEMQK